MSSRNLKPVNIAEVCERDIELYLIRKMKAIGGRAYKFTSPGMRAVPDRICVAPTGLVIFVEVKKPGGKPTPKQNKEIQRLLDFGALAMYVNSKATVDLLIKQLQEAINARFTGDSTIGSIIRPQ